MQLFSLSLLILLIVICVASGHLLAKRKGLNPVFWGVMGGLFGPLALPFIFFSRTRKIDTRKEHLHKHR